MVKPENFTMPARVAGIHVILGAASASMVARRDPAVTAQSWFKAARLAINSGSCRPARAV